MSASLLSAPSRMSQASTSSSVYSITAPPLPLQPSPETLLPHLELAPHDLLPLLRHALLTGATQADVGLLKWLLSLEGDVGHLLPLDICGEDGENLVSLAIMGSAGREDKEECVRMLVRRTGVEGADQAGWTPLHLAALHSTPPLISFLLTSGADPHALSVRGFTPLDMTSDLPSHSEQSVLLTSAMMSIPPSLSPSLSSSASSSPRPSPIPSSRRPPVPISASVARAQLALRQERKEQMRWEKENWIKEVAGTAGVMVENLLDRQWEDEGEDKEEAKLMRRKRMGRRARVSIGGRPIKGGGGDEYGSSSESSSELDETDDDERDDQEFYDPHAPPPYTTLLVFSLPNLPSILDTLISDYPPNAHPRSWRSAPANAIYLFARFALYRCDEEWLEELIIGVVDRIEKGVYDNVEDLAHLAFWNYNTTLLLHLLRSDSGLEVSCHEMSLLIMLEELINAIHVFVIRVVEKRIDGVLDAALLDYESMSEEFGDVTFEGEWNFLKSLTGRGTTNAKKVASRIVPKAKDVFGSTSSPRGSIDLDAIARDGFGSMRESSHGGRASVDLSSSKGSSNGRPLSMADFRSPASRSQQGPSTPTTPLFSSTSSSNQGPPIGIDVSSSTSTAPTTPRTITAFLTSVLVVLQLYEVNPAITCQAFSQVYYWVGCEAFNRILTRKKYLCRSKAIQIKMNMTALEDWVRDSGLPIRIATRHLESVNQLLQWLQTCSSLGEFDHLISMVQSLRSLNPLQMRRATRDYRFEVNEGKMSEECAQYLAQLQKDWEKRRVRIGVEALQRQISGKERARLDKYGSRNGSPSAPSHPKAPSEDRPYNPALLEPATVIDALFDPSMALGDYNPPTSPECMGELLDSRFMLPFSLPSDSNLLTATPPDGAAYAFLNQDVSAGNPTVSTHRRTDSANPLSPALMGVSPRLSQRTSFSSLRPLLYAQRPRNSLKELPDEFLKWLDEQEQSRIRRDSRHIGSRLTAAVELTRSSISVDSQGKTPTGPSSSGLPPVEDDKPHLPVSHSWPATREIDVPMPAMDRSTFTVARESNSPGRFVDDFGGYSKSYHSKEDSERTVSSHSRDDGSERTVSSHGRDGSSRTIRKPERTGTIMPGQSNGNGGEYRAPPVPDLAREEPGQEPGSPRDRGSWLKKTLGRKGSVMSLVEKAKGQVQA